MTLPWTQQGGFSMMYFPSSTSCGLRYGTSQRERRQTGDIQGHPSAPDRPDQDKWGGMGDGGDHTTSPNGQDVPRHLYACGNDIA